MGISNIAKRLLEAGCVGFIWQFAYSIFVAPDARLLTFTEGYIHKLRYSGSFDYWSIFPFLFLPLLVILPMYTVRRFRILHLENQKLAQGDSSALILFSLIAGVMCILAYGKGTADFMIFFHAFCSGGLNLYYIEHALGEGSPTLYVIFGGITLLITIYYFLRKKWYSKPIKQMTKSGLDANSTIRTSTLWLVILTCGYLYIEFSFNLFLLEVVALDRHIFYSNIDTVGRFLSGVGISIFVIQRMNWKLPVKNRAALWHVTLRKLPIVASIIWLVFTSQKILVDVISLSVSDDTKIEVVKAFSHSRHYQELLFTKDKEQHSNTTNSRSLISASFTPFLAVSGLLDSSKIVDGLNESDKLERLESVFNFHIDTNSHLYTRSHFAKDAFTKKDTKHNHNVRQNNPNTLYPAGLKRKRSYSIGELFWMHSLALENAYTSATPRKIAKAQQKAYLKYRTGYREFLRDYPYMKDERRTQVMRKELGREGIRIPNWHHNQVTRAKNAIYAKVKSDMMSGQERTIKALNANFVAPKTNVPLNEAAVVESILLATKGWYFQVKKDGLHSTQLLHSRPDAAKKQLALASKNLARYHMNYTQEALDEKYKALLAPTIALFMSFILITLNVFNVLWLLASEKQNLYTKEQIKRAYGAKWSSLLVIVTLLLIFGLTFGSSAHVALLGESKVSGVWQFWLAALPMIITATLMDIMHLFKPVALTMNFFVDSASVYQHSELLHLFSVVDSQRVNHESMQDTWTETKSIFRFLCYSAPIALLWSMYSYGFTKDANRPA